MVNVFHFFSLTGLEVSMGMSKPYAYLYFISSLILFSVGEEIFYGGVIKFKFLPLVHISFVCLFGLVCRDFYHPKPPSQKHNFDPPTG